MTIRIESQIAAHAEGLYDVLRDERIYKFLDEAPPKSLEVVRERIERLLLGAPASTGETWMNWTVFEDETVVGYTQATVCNNGTANLAYVLSSSVWGRSVAYAACVLTLADIRDRKSVDEIIADTEVQNRRSQALLERLGFVRTHSSGQDVFYKLTFP